MSGDTVRIKVSYPASSAVFEYSRHEYESAVAEEQLDDLMDWDISDYEHSAPTIEVLND